MKNRAFGISELKEARDSGRSLLAAVFLFSVFVNLLMLTGPLFMLQTYDRVLGSRSEATLAALFILVCVLYFLMAFLIMRVGAFWHALVRAFSPLDDRVFGAVLKKSLNRISPAPSTACVILRPCRPFSPHLLCWRFLTFLDPLFRSNFCL